MIAINRRRFLEVTGIGSVLAGIAPWRPAAADGKPLSLRSRRDIAVLDPGWMVGEASPSETIPQEGVNETNHRYLGMVKPHRNYFQRFP